MASLNICEFVEIGAFSDTGLEAVVRGLNRGIILPVSIFVLIIGYVLITELGLQSQPVFWDH